MSLNYKQIFAKKERIKKDWLKLNPKLNNYSGIYILTREENGFKYGYIGQATHLIDRLVSHSEGYSQHIDKSLKAHKLYSEDNPNGWKVDFINCPIQELNSKEMEYTRQYANLGYQLRNKTGGSQGEGKFGINENKSPKNYTQGVEHGYLKARKEISSLFNKYLDYSIKDKPNKYKENALIKFKEFISIPDNNS